MFTMILNTIKIITKTNEFKIIIYTKIEEFLDGIIIDRRIKI